MKFGFYLPTRGEDATTDALTGLVSGGEQLGFHSVTIADHIVFPTEFDSKYPYTVGGGFPGQGDAFEQLTLMSFIAAKTETLRLVTSVMIVPHRNPVVTAKMLATIDVLSKGRVTVGVGVGWLAEEFAALGQPFETRGPRTDECIAALRALWGEQPASFRGEHVSFAPMYCMPRPVNGSVPIIVGGHSKAAARRAGRLGDGFFPARDAPQELIQLARDTAEQGGRDPAKLEITVSMPVDRSLLDDYARMGVDRVLVPVSDMAGLGVAIANPDEAKDWTELIERYAD